ncbi:MAG TPA: hypothetical protein VHP32_06680 [Ignavibacteria bacterium]|nr:hypothetical protein [Ignavibacteria bacterium]
MNEEIKVQKIKMNEIIESSKSSNFNLNKELEQDSMFKLLSVNKVRKLLGLSYCKTLNLIKDGQIGYKLIGNKIMVPKIELWKYINETKGNVNQLIKNKFKNIQYEIDSIINN